MGYIEKIEGFIKKSWEEGTHIERHNILVIAIVGGSAHFVLCFVYKYMFGLYENIYLRMIAVALCISTIFYNKLPEHIKKHYFPFYWHLTLIWALPFLLTVNLLKTNFHETWLYWEIFMVFALVIYVPNLLIYMIDLIIGVSSAILYYIITTPEIYLSYDFDVSAYLIVLIFTILTGGIIIGGNRNAWTLKKEYEQKIKLNSFAGSIVHEMRNPLSSISSSVANVELYLRKKIREDNNLVLTQEDLENIHDCHKSVLSSIQMANEVIDITLDNLKGHPIDKTNFQYLSSKKVIQKSIDQYGYKNLLEKNRVEVIGEDFILKGNENLLIYVLFNLLKNALYYLEEYPESKIIISSKKKFNIGLRKNINQIIFRDTGPGIPADKIPFIFESFASFDKKGGTGLGLPFCKRVMKSFSGNIKCRSELGKYTEFILSFPVIKKGELENIDFDAQGTKILVVDDIESNLSIIKAFFKNRIANIHCDIAKNGQEAVKMAKDINYDFILMDIQMPVMDGIEATKNIRKFNNYVPIIIYSSESSKETLDKALKSGINDFLVKPVSNQMLLRTISKWSLCNQYQELELIKKGDAENILKGKRILFADDQNVNLAVTSRSIEKYETLVDKVKNGQQLVDEFIKKTKNDPKYYDLILTDVNMPIKNGDIAAQEIRQYQYKKNPQNITKNTPIIAITGESQKEEIYRLLSSEIDDYFIKGQPPINLIEQIAFWIKYHEDLSKSENDDFDNYDQYQLFDGSRLADFDDQEIKDLSQQFIKNSQELINKIIRGASDKNAKDVFFYSHALKGSSGNIGAVRLHKYCNHINEISRGDKLPNNKDWTVRLEELFEKTKTEMS